MSPRAIRGYAAGTNAPVLLSEEEATAGFTNGAYRPAPDQLVPIRFPDGVIRGVPGADAGALLAQEGHSLDYSTTAARVARLRAEATSRSIQAIGPGSGIGPAGETLVAGATALANATLMGLPGLAEKQQEHEAAQAHGAGNPDPTQVAYYRERGASLDEALLLATPAYEGAGYTEDLASQNRIASVAGTVAGYLGPAIVTGGASAAAEVPLAEAAAGGLARLGAGETVARIGGQAVAGGVANAALTATELGVQRAGEYAITGQGPQTPGMDAGLVVLAGGLGVTAPLLFGFGREGIRSLASARTARAALATRTALTDVALASNEEALVRIEGQLTQYYDGVGRAQRMLNEVTPTGDPSRIADAQAALVRARQGQGVLARAGEEVAGIMGGPELASAQRRMQNPNFVRRMLSEGNDAAEALAERLNVLSDNAMAAEAAFSTRLASEVAAGTAEHLAQLGEAGAAGVAIRLGNAASNFVSGEAYGAQLLLQSNPSPIARRLVGIGESMQQAIMTSPEKAASGLVNVRTELARLAGDMPYGTPPEFVKAADDALDAFDGLMADTSLFGERAAAASEGLSMFRQASRARRQALAELGKGAAEGTRVEREFTGARLAAYSSQADDIKTIAGRRSLGAFLRTSLAAGALDREAVNEAARGLEDVFLTNEARAIYRGAQNSGKFGGSIRGMINSTTGLITGTVLGGGGGGAIGFAGGSALGALTHPEQLAVLVHHAKALTARLAETKAATVARGLSRINMPDVSLRIPAKTVRNLISNPALYASETHDAEFDALVHNIDDYSNNPNLVATRLQEAGVNINSAVGSQAVTQQVQAMAYLRSQMPESLFNTLNPTPPSRRVSSMVHHRVIRILEAVDNPLSTYDDFAHGFVSPDKVAANRALYGQLHQEMTAEFLGAYSDRVARQERVPYATRQNLSILLGQPLTDALRPENLQLLQGRFAQTSQQAQAQGMGRQPARAATSITTSTMTEGSALQDSQ